MYVLELSYPLSDYDWGTIDASLEKLIGQMTGASGTGFGYRDLVWYFENEEDRGSALMNITRAKCGGLFKKVEVRTYNS